MVILGLESGLLTRGRIAVLICVLRKDGVHVVSDAAAELKTDVAYSIQPCEQVACPMRRELMHPVA